MQIKITKRSRNQFWAKVAKGKKCWLWTGGKDKDGYGQFRHWRAHRFSYTSEVGPIPIGLQIDHLCRTVACVRPSHLEVVTCKENLMRGFGPSAICARKKRCIRGHPFSGKNLMMGTVAKGLKNRRRPTRLCRKCKYDAWRRWWDSKGSEKMKMETVARRQNKGILAQP